MRRINKELPTLLDSRATRPAKSQRNLKNGLVRNLRQTEFCKPLPFVGIVLGSGYDVLRCFFQHVVYFLVLLRFYSFPFCALNPNKSQHFSNILLGSGFGFGMSKFPPTIFPFLLSEGSPGVRKNDLFRELGMAGLESQVLN